MDFSEILIWLTDKVRNHLQIANEPFDFSTTVLTIQAIGFATGTALCWLLAVLQRRSDRLTRGNHLYSWLFAVGSLWTSGSFAIHVFLLLGLSSASRPVRTAEVIAWISTCLLPTLISRILEQEIRSASRLSRLLMGISMSLAGVLLLLLFMAAFKSGFPLTVQEVAHLTFYNAIVHLVGWVIIIQRHRRRQTEASRATAPTLLFVRATVVLCCLNSLAILVSIYAPARFRGLRVAGLVVGQQMLVALAVLAAAFLAKSRYADVVLKRSLHLIMSVVAAVIVVWGVPGLAPGLPVVLTSLLVAALILAAPSGYRLLNRGVDRLILKRPEYPALTQAFADDSRRCVNQAELFALAEACVREALHLDAHFVAAASSPAFDSLAANQTGLERLAVKGAGGTDYMLELCTTTEGRTLMHEEMAFLRRLGAETTRRLEALEFERERRELQLREERLRHSLTEAELKALRAQVDPHFLFNTLNTIADLISTDPEKAEAMTERLAEFFRYTLSRTEQTLSTLDQELDFVRHYLGIEQVRFGERLRVEFSRDPALGREMVPSLILQPLVENAVRHGLAPKLAGGSISVSATCEGEFLRLQVTDDGVGMQNGAGRRSGIGLQNVRERLRALYGQMAQLKIDSDALGVHRRGTCVTLLLPRHDQHDD